MRQKELLCTVPWAHHRLMLFPHEGKEGRLRSVKTKHPCDLNQGQKEKEKKKKKKTEDPQLTAVWFHKKITLEFLP